jgi:DNA-binding LacI/PurR family transcriptional regulator
VYNSVCMAPNIYEVAHAAGVSVTTVSHALSGRGRVAPATRERVLRIAEQVGYAANPHAQRLVSGRSRTLAIQIAGFGVAGSTEFLPDAAFFLDLLNAASARAAERGYELILASYDLDPRRAQSLAIDGAVVVDPSGDEVLLRELPDRGIPVVTTSRPTIGSMRFPWVDNDQGGMAVRAFEHFVRMGYRRPAVIATARRRSYVADIIDAYVEWSRRRGTEPLVVELPEPPSEAAAGRAARRLLALAEPPDAFYATYDRLALGVLRETRRMGLDAPRDLGIASAVDGEVLRWVEPSITAADIKPGLLGAGAISNLVDIVEGRPVSASVIVPSRLVVRGSTRRGRDAGGV